MVTGRHSETWDMPSKAARYNPPDASAIRPDTGKPPRNLAAVTAEVTVEVTAAVTAMVTAAVTPRHTKARRGGRSRGAFPARPPPAHPRSRLERRDSDTHGPHARAGTTRAPWNPVASTIITLLLYSAVVTATRR